MPITDLNVRKVLITEAASGIGRAATLAFARRGGTPLLCDIDSTGFELPHRQIQDTGGESHIHAVDVTDANATAELAARVHFTHGALDVLVNNAGTGYLGQLLDSSLDHRKRGCSLDLVAEGIVHAVLKGRDLILVGPFSRLILQLRRISVGMLRRIVLNDACKIGYV